MPSNNFCIQLLNKILIKTNVNSFNRLHIAYFQVKGMIVLENSKLSVYLFFTIAVYLFVELSSTKKSPQREYQYDAVFSSSINLINHFNVTFQLVLTNHFKNCITTIVFDLIQLLDFLQITYDISFIQI